MSYDDFINVALDAAVLAGEKIMEVYKKELETLRKVK